MARAPLAFQGRGLSVIEPWASAVAFAGKDVENRSRRTRYRGPLAIHASRRPDPAALEQSLAAAPGQPPRSVAEWIARGRLRWQVDEPARLVRPGHIVALAMLVDCVASSSSPWYVEGWAWLLAGVVPIEPVPWTGDLGLWSCEFEYQPLSRRVTARRGATSPTRRHT